MTSKEILNLLIHQLENVFLLTNEEKDILLKVMSDEQCYMQLIDCLRHDSCRSINEDNGLNPFNTVIYCNYLYRVSHFLYSNGYSVIADKVYYLNKMLNSVDLFYAIELPQYWNCEHPIGSVMGRAKYGNYFFFYQGCTVGGNHSDYPVIGDNVTMFSNSKILGKSRIGNNVVIGANAYIKDTDIPDNSMVFGQFPNIIIKQNTNSDQLWK